MDCLNWGFIAGFGVWVGNFWKPGIMAKLVPFGFLETGLMFIRTIAGCLSGTYGGSYNEQIEKEKGLLLCGFGPGYRVYFFVFAFQF